MDGIARLFTDFSSDILSYPDYIANRSVGVLYTHVDDAAVIRFAVKGCVDFHPTFAELDFNVVREYYINGLVLCS